MATRQELGAQDQRDALLSDDFATDDLPGSEDRADEIKAEMMRLLEARSGPPASPPEGELEKTRRKK